MMNEDSILLDNEYEQVQIDMRKIAEYSDQLNQISSLEKTVLNRHQQAVEEETQLISEMLKSETFAHLLRENIHSFALFHDYFTETENPYYDPKLNRIRYHDLVIESDEESKGDEGSSNYKLDTILHTNSFKIS